LEGFGVTNSASTLTPALRNALTNVVRAKAAGASLAAGPNGGSSALNVLYPRANAGPRFSICFPNEVVPYSLG